MEIVTANDRMIDAAVKRLLLVQRVARALERQSPSLSKIEAE